MCFYKRLQAVKLVSILNSIVLLQAAAIIYLAVRFNQSSFYTLPGSLSAYAASTFTIFLSFGIVCIIATFIGYIALKVKNRAVAIFFGVMLTPVWLVFIISGISLLSISYSASDVLNSVCQSSNLTSADGPSQI